MTFGDNLYDFEKNEQIQEILLETDWLEIPDNELNNFKI
jgi:hypothetical protein